MNYLKAIVGGIYAAAIVLIPIVDDGLKPSEFLTALTAGLVGAGLIYVVPNTPKGQ